MLRVDHARDTGRPGRKRRLVPNATVRMDHVWSDPSNLLDERSGPDHGKAGDVSADMECGELFKTFRKTSQVVQSEYMSLESTLIDEPHQVRDYAFHASVVKVLNDVEDPSSSRAHLTKYLSRCKCTGGSRSRGSWRLNRPGTRLVESGSHGRAFLTFVVHRLELRSTGGGRSSWPAIVALTASPEPLFRAPPRVRVRTRARIVIEFPQNAGSGRQYPLLASKSVSPPNRSELPQVRKP